ncbi:hypothetical protein A3D68_02170 [Candidatus Adlerbacteria bacterium RIFCSPHIGHO2_02_FULL_52_17]|uniref:Uncharacterized protein n=1 Tax=Candidatus Adlerbacteria bacterium RIFCSPHIGHO2_02_FULL_52_17 TaxID=1797240 RepID=A0A1F4XME0_9BACT|nr:MAG: hypothetical protein A3D68_02170 [Candidatus Adlerbacteria bacterium RIFCSPHIGHO2_02_FULL_52_17]
MAHGGDDFRKTRVTERVHIKVERWKKGARKPETDTITIIRTRSRNGPLAGSIQEMAERFLRGFPKNGEPPAISSKKKDE